MKTNIDCTIESKENKTTISFISKKAQNALRDQSEDVRMEVYKENNVLKLDIANNSLNNMIAFLISYNLSSEKI